MPDLLRVVTLSPGGRPVVALDLNDGVGYKRITTEPFEFVPPPSTVQYSRRTKRFGGATAVGETHDNGTIGWTAYVVGTSAQEAATRVEALLTRIYDASRGRYVQWVPAGLASSFLEITGPGTYTPTIESVEFTRTTAMKVRITFPALPLVRWSGCSIGDDFNVDSRADYVFDAATSADVSVSGGALNAVVGASLATERRARHVERGYTWSDGTVALVAKVPTVLTTGFKAGVILSATPTGYIEAYVDDNGTNSRIRIDVVIAGVRTNRASTNLGVRLTGGQTFALAIEVNRWTGPGGIGPYSVNAHYWLNGVPLFGNIGDNFAQYTLAESGVDAGLPTTGHMGWSWIPAAAGAQLLDFFAYPFHQYGASTHRFWFGNNAIPGNAPAKADLLVSGGGLAAPWALFSSAKFVQAPLAGSVMPFGAINASTGADLANWTSVSNPYAHGMGFTLNVLRDAAVSGAKTYTASYLIDPSSLAADDFTDDTISMEVWARLELSTSQQSPTIAAKITNPDGAGFGTDKWTQEWGSAGYTPVVPGAAAMLRLYRVGTIIMPASPSVRRTVKLWLVVTTAAGSTGSLGAEALFLYPSRSRTAGPTAKINDATYPQFIPTANTTDKLIRSDVSGAIGTPGKALYPDHGLGGSEITLPPGNGPLGFLACTRVPNDPTASTSDDTMQLSLGTRLDVTPRSFMLRPS